MRSLRRLLGLFGSIVVAVAVAASPAPALRYSNAAAVAAAVADEPPPPPAGFFASPPPGTPAVGAFDEGEPASPATGPAPVLPVVADDWVADNASSTSAEPDPAGTSVDTADPPGDATAAAGSVATPDAGTPAPDPAGPTPATGDPATDATTPATTDTTTTVTEAPPPDPATTTTTGPAPETTTTLDPTTTTTDPSVPPPGAQAPTTAPDPAPAPAPTDPTTTAPTDVQAALGPRGSLAFRSETSERGSPATSMPGDSRRVRYVVSPHPDDEFEGWSLVEHSPDHYTVFILLTRGEASSYCSGQGILHTDTGDQTQFGERLPSPQPFAGRFTSECAAERVDSWHSFLDAAAAADPAVDRPAFVGHFVGEVRRGDVAPVRLDHGMVRPATNYDLYVGARSARLVFDLGDGQLTAAKVTWAIQTARRIRSARFPVSAEDDIVGSAYYNAAYPGYVHYTHPDHYAVQLALFATDQGTPGPQWGRTVPNDPNRRRRAYVDNETYCAAMCVSPLPIDPWHGPRSERVGALQRVYGWLAFTGETSGSRTNSFWAASFEPTQTVFSQAQDFWRRFGERARRLRAARRVSPGRVSSDAGVLGASAIALVGLAAPISLRRRRRS